MKVERVTQETHFRPARTGQVMSAVPLMLAWVWALSDQATDGALTLAPHLALYLLGLIAVSTAFLDRRAPFVLVAGLLFASSSIWDVGWHLSYSESFLLTPPHALLAAATLVALVHWQSRSTFPTRVGGARERISGVVSDALVILWVALMTTEYVGRPNLWHGSEFYVVAAAVFPALLVVAGKRVRFGATWVAFLYPAFLLVGHGLAALAYAVPAPHAASGPGTSPVLAHFPMLLFAPALAVDFVLHGAPQRLTIGSAGARALVVGPSVLTLMLLSHWPTADLLLDTELLSRLWPEGLASAPWTSEYWNLDDSTRRFAGGLAIAGVLATTSAALGFGYAAVLQRADPSKATPIPLEEQG